MNITEQLGNPAVGHRENDSANIVLSRTSRLLFDATIRADGHSASDKDPCTTTCRLSIHSALHHKRVVV